MANKFAQGITTAEGTRKTKDNSRKHPYEREQFITRQRAGRPKQVWVGPTPGGHWEKTA